jgi:hypothetical protein
LQQQQGIAGQFQENKKMAWYDRAFDSMTTIAAFPLGFLMGDVMDFKTPTGEEQKTTEINILTDEVTIQQNARAAEPAQQAAPGASAEATTEAAQETAQQQAMMERKAFEEAWYRDHSDGREREREQEI